MFHVRWSKHEMFYVRWSKHEMFYVRWSNIIGKIIHQLPLLRNIVICEEKYKFTPDDFKATTRSQRKTSHAYSISHKTSHAYSISHKTSHAYSISHKASHAYSILHLCF
jgi:hypothetical protein